MNCRISVSGLTKVYAGMGGPALSPLLRRIAGLAGMQAPFVADSRPARPAVDGVSFTIRDGERVGIIGANGAGKSTLLHILAGVASPTSGTVDIVGRVHSVLTLGLGLREDLTGRENLYIDGEVQGKERHEIDARIADMVEFAELGEYIDRPVRTYSSGMKARLAFTSLAFTDPEILIIDEVLSVGDHKFSGKATKAIRELCAKGRIVLVVSHSLESIVQMCSRCIWLDQGRIVADGEPTEVTERYRKEVHRRDEVELAARFSARGEAMESGACRIETAVIRQTAGGTPTTVLTSGVDGSIEVLVHIREPIARADLRLRVERLDGVWLSENRARAGGVDLDRRTGRLRVGAEMTPVVLAPGTYRLVADVLEERDGVETAVASRTVMFKVVSDETWIGAVPALYYPMDVSCGGSASCP